MAEFEKLIAIHYDLLNQYFLKTFEIASGDNGLFAERGGPFEAMGYPLRSFEYINYLIYYFEARLHWPKFDKKLKELKVYNLRLKQKECLKKLLINNLGTKRPVIDGNLIAILNVFLFFYRHNDLTKGDREFLAEYLNDIFGNILISYHLHKVFPELKNNIKALTEFLVSGTRPKEYEDRSSLLITILFELTVLLNAPDIYKIYRSEITGKVNLQTAYTALPEKEFEIFLFEKTLHNEYYVEASINLPEEFKEFKDAILKKSSVPIHHKTDEAGFPFLLLLAHSFFENEFLPGEWRRFIS